MTRWRPANPRRVERAAPQPVELAAGQLLDDALEDNRPDRPKAGRGMDKGSLALSKGPGNGKKQDLAEAVVRYVKGFYPDEYHWKQVIP